MRILKVILLVLLCAVALGAAGFAYLYFRSPASAPPRVVNVDMSPERVERGRYIFTSIAHCDSCHSEHEYTKLGAPVKADRRGVGQVMPIKDLPGRIVASNITPDPQTGIGTWTDGEKIRAIREGISKNGHMLFPLMPYGNYRYMSDDDVESLVAYLNSLPAVRNEMPKTEVAFPVSMFVKSAPRPVEGKITAPKPGDGDRYGEYLVTLASCEECHTPMVRGEPDTSMRYAGGRVFATPYGTVVSANITSDPETGIGKWEFQRFYDRVQSYRQYHATETPDAGPDKFTLMPWHGLAGLSDQDLTAIFGYIKGRAPIVHKVETHPGS